MTHSFTPVRDPVTGRIDMVPYVAPQWGDRAVSPAARSAIGPERYDTLYPEGFDGVIRDEEHLHDATLVEVTSMLAPHVDDETMGALVRQWTDAARMVRDGSLRVATVAFGMRMDDDDEHDGITHTVLNISRHEIILTMFCDCGETKAHPLTYWSDRGAFSTNQVDEEDIDPGMVDLDIQMRRRDETSLAVSAARRQAQQPQGVIDMAAYRVLRAVRAA